MSKYRKKPVVIEAFHLGIEDAPEWFIEAVEQDNVAFVVSPDGCVKCKIRTLEGVMEANAGVDYIIRGVDGELYPCKADIFEKTYEAVTEDE